MPAQPGDSRLGHGLGHLSLKPRIFYLTIKGGHQKTGRLGRHSEDKQISYGISVGSGDGRCSRSFIPRCWAKG